MLQPDETTQRIVDAFDQYLRELLQISPSPTRWKGEEALPYYLRDLYVFYQANILGTPNLLMVARGDSVSTPAVVGRHIASVREMWDGEVVYVQAAISAYNRKRLIEQKVPFVVPGNQMFLASLGIDLREHFRRDTEQDAQISPATQVVVLYALLQADCREHTPSELARTLSYTRMTMSRAFDELMTTGLATVETRGRERVLRFEGDKRSLWERSHHLLASPVRKREWVHLPSCKWRGVFAGLTALAHYTMLAPPNYAAFAVNAKEWKTVSQLEGFAVLPQAEPDAARIEIWSYDPRLLAADNLVDRLSLSLTMREDNDERVESAVEDMMERLPW
jgi:DNA-binding MarR family transcriptional regulator